MYVLDPVPSGFKMQYNLIHQKHIQSGAPEHALSLKPIRTGSRVSMYIQVKCR